ncbi:MAG: carboxypeptidase regulatory-like domain-containing protein [Planctomycetes bacterium]|nr:carboxypeptidase regulatory-like domain-containing protein [Planctomycetota bacterium]
MKLKHLALALLLLTMILALIWKNPFGHPSHPALETGQSVVAPSNTETALSASPTVAKDERQIRTQAPRQASPTLSPSESSDTPFNQELITVTGVAADAFQTIPNATGYYAKHEQIPPERRALAVRLGQGERIKVTKEFGTPFQTDPNGTTQIPKTGKSIWVYLEKGNLSGHVTHALKYDVPLQVSLYPNSDLLVSVIDHEKNLVPNLPFRVLDRTHDYFVDHSAESITDETGIRMLRGLGKYRSKLNVKRGLCVVPKFTMSEAEMYQTEWPMITEEKVAEGKLTLQLPQTAEMVIEIVDANGQPISQDGYVNLFPHQVQDFGWRWHPHDQAKIIDGSARFRRVGLNASLKVAVNSESYRKTEFIVEGPKTAGEIKVINVVVSPNPTLSGIALHPNGEPFANQELLLEIRASSHEADRIKITTKQDGSWILAQRKMAVDNKYESVPISIKANSEAFGLCIAAAELPLDYQDQNFDMGEIRIEKLALLFSGRILDPSGKPISLAHVTLSPGSLAASKSEPGRRRSNLHAQIDEDGQFFFEDHGNSHNSYHILISSYGYTTVKQDIVVGTENAVFKLQKPGRLKGTILLADGLGTDDLRIQLGNQRLDSYGGLEPKANLSTIGLNAKLDEGKDYELVIKTRLREVVFQLPGIRFDGTGDIEPPQLQPLDLRTSLNSIQFEVYDPNANPLPATVFLYGNKSSTSLYPPSSKSRVVVLRPIEQVRISAVGYCDALLENVWSEQRVTLRPASEVTIRIPAKWMQIDNFTPKLTARSVNQNVQPNCSKFDADGVATLYIAEPGDFRLGLELIWTTNGTSATESDRGQVYANIKPDQIIDLKLDESRMDKFLSKFRRQ